MRGKIYTLMTVIIAFLTGVLAMAIYANAAIGSDIIQQPLGSPQELASPGDWIEEDQIKVTKSRVVLEIPDVIWARFTDTNSMDPTFDQGSNAIQIMPENPGRDINVGDIVSYKSDFSDGRIIHRVVYKGFDEDGVYFIMKGDNNPTSDPGKVRPDQIYSVTIGVLY